MNSKCQVTKKGVVDFDLGVPGRVYNLKCLEYTANEWVNMLQKEIIRLSAVQKPSLDNC